MDMKYKKKTSKNNNIIIIKTDNKLINIFIKIAKISFLTIILNIFNINNSNIAISLNIL